MPLTLRKFSAQVRDETTGDMIPAGLLSSDALGAINTAKTDAVAAVEGQQAVSEAAIELKGATTLASIPNDYTALQGEVDDLETQLQFSTSGNIVVYQGYWAFADGIYADSSTWCRSATFVDKNVVLQTTNIKMFILAYNASNGSYVGAWNGSGFSTAYNASGVLYKIDIHEWLNSYPNYCFKIDFWNSGSTLNPSGVLSDLQVNDYVYNRFESDESKINDINEIIYTRDITVITTYIQGTKQSNGNPYANSARCCTQNIYSLVEGDTISITNIDNGLKAAVTATTGSSFLPALGWKTENYSYTVTENTEAYYFVSIAKTDDTADITPSDIHTLTVTITQNKRDKFEDIDENIDTIENALMNGGNVETEFIQGTRRSDGTINNVSYRCCTKNVFALVPGNRITISKIGTGLKAGITGYANGNFVYLGSSWITEEGTTFTVSTAGTYFVSIAKTDDTADITPSDITNTAIIIKTYDYLNKIDDISAIKAGLRSRFNGKNVSIIGDSIDTFNGTGYKIDGYAMYYPQDGVNDVNETWWMQVIENSGAKLEVNASASGSRVTDTLDDATRPDFYERVGVIGNPDLIFVTLGTNDSYNSVALGEYDFETAYTSLSESTFRTAYIKGIKALQALYPSAGIVCVAEWMTDDYKNSIVHICNTLSCEYIDASDYTQTSVSNIHPGILGMMEIASRILYPTDKTLTQSHIAADAKTVGDELTTIKAQIADIMAQLS